jgi:predicted transcriptional regulator
MIDGRQIRAARGILGWSREELLAVADVSKSALLRMESGLADTRGSTILKVMKALEDAGIEFISQDDGAIGVLLHPGQR